MKLFCSNYWQNLQIVLLVIIFRSSHRKCSVNKVFLKNRKIQRKSSMLESLFNRVAEAEACFPVNFAKLLRTHFLQSSSGGCYWSFWIKQFCIKLKRHIPCQGELPRLYTNLDNLYFFMNLTNFVPKSHTVV